MTPPPVKPHLPLAFTLVFTLLVAHTSWSQTGRLPAGRNVLVANYLRVPPLEDTENLRLLAETHDLLILHSWSESKLDFFRQVNPDIVLLLYLNRGFTRNSVESVDTYFNVRHIDEMFMHDWAGNHILWDWDYNGTLDAASPRPESQVFQDYFIPRCFDRVAQGGWDGVCLDDLWSYETVYGIPDPREYANNYDLQEAMADFLSALNEEGNRRGFYVTGNIGWWGQRTRDGGRCDQLYLSNMDLAFQEKFLHSHGNYWNDGDKWLPEIQHMVDLMRQTRRAIFMKTRGDTEDRRAMLYGLCSYLCITDRDGLALYQYSDSYSTSRMPSLHWEYAAAEELGAPVSDVRWLSSARFGYRLFQYGAVVVNPNSHSVHVQGAAGMYDIDGNRIPVSGGTLPPHSGMILFHSQSLTRDTFNAAPELSALRQD